MGPGLNYPVAGRAEAGAVFTVTGRTEEATWLEVEDQDGHTVWVSTDVVETNYPPSAARVTITPAPPAEYVVADNVADYGPEQGEKNWFYVASEYPGSLDFDYMPWDTQTGKWYRWCCSRERSKEMRLSKSGGFPSSQSDVMRIWSSQYQGLIRIEGKVAKESGAGRGGNGVSMRIVQRGHDSENNVTPGIQLWSGHLAGSDTEGTSYDVGPITVEPHDAIHFILSANGNDSSDNTIFTARIILMNEDGVSLPVTATPTPPPTNTPVPKICFEPRLRHYEEHKGCCGEVAGIAYRGNGRLSWGSLHIEGPPAPDQYRREFAINRDGGYEVTALNQFADYTIWLKGSRIRSRKFVVHYEDKVRAIVDFYQVPCW